MTEWSKIYNIIWFCGSDQGETMSDLWTSLAELLRPPFKGILQLFYIVFCFVICIKNKLHSTRIIEWWNKTIQDGCFLNILHVLLYYVVIMQLKKYNHRFNVYAFGMFRLRLVFDNYLYISISVFCRKTLKYPLYLCF